MKRISGATVGTFKKTSVDFIRTVLPLTEANQKRSLTERIRAFLRERPTSNAVHLSKKAVVGLFPKTIFAKVLWPSPPKRRPLWITSVLSPIPQLRAIGRLPNPSSNRTQSSRFPVRAEGPEPGKF